jgi:hypothetical protein
MAKSGMSDIVQNRDAMWRKASLSSDAHASGNA